MNGDGYDGVERRHQLQGTGLLERHIQTGIQAILVGLVLWVGSSILAIREDVAVLRERSATQGVKLEALNAELKVAIDQRRQLIEAYEGRLRGIESRVEAIEVHRVKGRQ
jgi:hypothetical protein